MTKVGTDKRLSYYQLAADEVVAALHSHRYGLTAPEAKRRLLQNGANTINSASYTPARSRRLLQPWLLGMLIASVAGAWYQNDSQLATALTAITLLVMLADVWREHGRNNLQYHIHQLIPHTTTVRRNDQAKVIDSAELVVGDIIELEVGMLVPADLRVLQADKLLVDDALLFGSNGHSPKSAHSIAGELPLAQRHNLLFAGSRVLSGGGLGIVTATGMQTELGRILAQAEVVTPKQSLFQHSFRHLSRRFSWVAIALLAILGIIVTQSDIEYSTGGTYALALVVSLLPISVAFAAVRMFTSFGGDARRQRLLLGSNSVADRLGSLDTLLIDENNFIIESNSVVTEFLIGKKLQKPSATQLTPNGSLVDEKGKPLSQDTLDDQRLFFDALALSTHTTLLAPSGDTTQWHAAGSADEAALVALASQAGVDIMAARRDHPQLAYHIHDHARNMASTIHRYDHRQMAFVYGGALEVITKATKIWDAGHTRKLSAKDISAAHEYCANEAERGNHVLALAYRQFTQKIDSTSLTATETETDLTILGFVSIGQALKSSVKKAMKSMRTAGIAVSFISKRQIQVAVGTAKQLGITKPVTISDDELVQLDDTQLVEILASGSAIFWHITPESRLRLVDVAERSNRHIGLSGTGLSDVPALRRATISLCASAAPQALCEESDLMLTTDNLSDATHAYTRSRKLSAHLQRIMQSTLADHSIQLWLVVISFGLYLSDRIPLASTAMLLLFATVLHSLAFAAVGEDPSGQRETPQTLAPHSSVVNVWLGLIGGLLICINFVYFFVRAGLSPSYIDSTSNLYLQAATVSFVTLVLCMWVNLLFTRAQHTTSLLSHQLRNKTLLQIFGLVILSLLAMIYSQPIQEVIGTRSLTITDWVWAGIVGASYFAIRLIAHNERQRSRHAVIALHHDIHGKDAGPKI